MQTQTTTDICLIEGCGRTVSSRKWRLCSKHYSKKIRTGDPRTIVRLRGATLQARFWRFVVVGDIPVHREDLGPCWIWKGTKSNGYGYFGTMAKKWPAYRFAYIELKGPVPEGLELDHLCRVRDCVNPDHLEPVTHRQNMIRSANYTHGRRSAMAALPALMHCPECGRGYRIEGHMRGHQRREHGAIHP